MAPLVSTSVMDLPVVSGPPLERADAARNRERILEAAERLFRNQGVERTSMDQIAREACVGKGTLFRRFGDRASLAFAVLDSTERAFQDGFLRGPPPLGPGAPAPDRLIAFGEAMLDNMEVNGEILLDAELSGRKGWLRSAPRTFHWMHVRNLIAEARPESDAGYLADVLLGALSPQVLTHQRIARGMSPEGIRSAYGDLVQRLLTEQP